MKKYLLFTLLALSVGMTISTAQSLPPQAPGSRIVPSCTEVTTLPATLTQPGNYCLDSDFTVDSASIKAITIAANDVTLDCAGHTIRNDAVSDLGTSEGIYGHNRNNVTVKNCRIQGGFTNGISFTQDGTQGNRNYYITIEGNFIGGPYLHGIRAFGSVIEVRDNRIYDIGGQRDTYAVGLRVGGAPGNAPRLHAVDGNAVAGVNSPYGHAYGIFSENSLASTFRGNTVTGTTAGDPGFNSWGIHVIGPVNTISGNHVIGSPLANDIGIHGSTSSSCYDNHVRSPVRTSGCNATLGNY